MRFDLTATDSLVVKVGGSLYDLGDLGPRLSAWVDTLPTQRVLLVPGGGPTADVIRTLDRRHDLGEEAAHWLALRALALNAHFLSHLVAGSVVVSAPGECADAWDRGELPILECHAFAVGDEANPGALLHQWDVTSDSVAARAALVLGSRQLILLKSIAIPEKLDWPEAARQGLVDAAFPEVVAGRLNVRSINLRDWPGPSLSRGG